MRGAAHDRERGRHGRGAGQGPDRRTRLGIGGGEEKATRFTGQGRRRHAARRGPACRAARRGKKPPCSPCRPPASGRATLRPHPEGGARPRPRSRWRQELHARQANRGNAAPVAFGAPRANSGVARRAACARKGRGCTPARMRHPSPCPRRAAATVPQGRAARGACPRRAAEPKGANLRPQKAAAPLGAGWCSP